MAAVANSHPRAPYRPHMTRPGWPDSNKSVCRVIPTLSGVRSMLPTCAAHGRGQSTASVPDWMSLSPAISHPYSERFAMKDSSKRRGHRALASMSFDSLEEAYQAPDSVWQQLLDGKHPIAVWRTFRGLSRQQLAETVQVELSLVVGYEQGRGAPPSHLLRRFAEALRVPVLALEPKIRLCSRVAGEKNTTAGLP